MKSWIYVLKMSSIYRTTVYIFRKCFPGQYAVDPGAEALCRGVQLPCSCSLFTFFESGSLSKIIIYYLIYNFLIIINSEVVSPVLSVH